jgi:hypothetical protein
LGSISTGENKLGKVTIGKNGVAYNNSQVVRGRVLADDPFKYTTEIKTTNILFERKCFKI